MVIDLLGLSEIDWIGKVKCAIFKEDIYFKEIYEFKDRTYDEGYLSEVKRKYVVF